MQEKGNCRNEQKFIVAAIAAIASMGAAAVAESDTARGDYQLLSSWHGVWRGSLEDAPIPLDHSPDVEFTVNPGTDENDGCLVWRSEYTVDGELRTTKDYQMCWQNDNYFRLDEGGGVYLNVLAIDDDLYSAFALSDDDIVLFSHTRRKGDVIIQDIYSTKGSDYPVPGIETYVGVKRQRVMLERVTVP